MILHILLDNEASFYAIHYRVRYPSISSYKLFEDQKSLKQASIYKILKIIYQLLFKISSV